MSNALLWGTQELEETGTPWAYCERLSHSLQMGVKEVLDGNGVVKWRKNWGAKYRVEGTFVPYRDYAAIMSDLRTAMATNDSYVQITDTDLGTLHVYLDNQTRERIAGEGGPGAMRLTLSGWAYPALDPDQP